MWSWEVTSARVFGRLVVIRHVQSSERKSTYYFSTHGCKRRASSFLADIFELDAFAAAAFAAAARALLSKKLAIVVEMWEDDSKARKTRLMI